MLKNRFLLLVSLVIVGLFAVIVYAQQAGPLGVQPSSINLSINSTQYPLGKIGGANHTNLSFFEVQGNYTFNLTLQGYSNVTNVTFMFMAVHNGSIMKNLTLYNQSDLNSSGLVTYWKFILNIDKLD